MLFMVVLESLDPIMREDASEGNPLLSIGFQHLINQVLYLRRQFVPGSAGKLEVQSSHYLQSHLFVIEKKGCFGDHVVQTDTQSSNVSGCWIKRSSLSQRNPHDLRSHAWISPTIILCQCHFLETLVFIFRKLQSSS